LSLPVLRARLQARCARPDEEEDNYGEADLPLAYIPRTGEILLLQMDGHMTQEEFERAIELAKGGCMKIYELQKEALRRRYSVAADEAMLREETREV